MELPGVAMWKKMPSLVLVIFFLLIGVSPLGVSLLWGEEAYSIVELQSDDGFYTQDSYELRFDDGSYENGINWYSQYVGDWVGFAKRMSANFQEDQFLLVEDIIIAFSRKEGTPSAVPDYDLVICQSQDGLPNVESIIWQENFTHSEDIPLAPDWVNVDHIPEEEVLISHADQIFFVCYFPRWGSGITPDPPFYFCLDMDSWLGRSYGNSVKGLPDWKTFPELHIVESELGVGVVVSLVTLIQPTSLGEIKALFK